MHSKDARARGESEQALVLDTWEEAPFYSERERAALALTDSVTGSRKAMCPTVFERAQAHSNEQELIALVFTLTTINAWNHLAITMRSEVGDCRTEGALVGGSGSSYAPIIYSGKKRRFSCLRSG